MITVFTTPNCVQCEQTKRALDKKNLEYKVVDLSKDPEAMALVQREGFSSAPVVFTDTDKWSGFRFNKLNALVANPTIQGPALAS